MGLGKAFNIDFDDVLVRAELVYQTRQKTYAFISAIAIEDDGLLQQSILQALLTQALSVRLLSRGHWR